MLPVQAVLWHFGTLAMNYILFFPFGPYTQWFIRWVWWFVHFITGEPHFSVHQYSQCEKVGNIFAQNYGYMANRSDAPKIDSDDTCDDDTPGILAAGCKSDGQKPIGQNWQWAFLNFLNFTTVKKTIPKLRKWLWSIKWVNIQCHSFNWKRPKKGLVGLFRPK